MKNALRFALTITALLVASVGPRSVATARGIYDGEWSVVIYTLRGDCDRALRYSLRIVDNRVLDQQQSYRLNGAVGPSGDIWVTVAEGHRSASGFGRLVGNSGRGRWRTSAGECAGNWTAERRVW
jgi:hypothetical protein